METEITSLEEAYGIGIPAEFRWFLSNIANGGVGPGYGLLALETPVTLPAASHRTMAISVSDEHGNAVHTAEINSGSSIGVFDDREPS